MKNLLIRIEYIKYYLIVNLLYILLIYLIKKSNRNRIIELIFITIIIDLIIVYKFKSIN